jgi:hypothetical protein
MVDSTFRQEDFLMNVNSAVGHYKGSLVKYPVMMLGAGGMYSTSNDMMNFILCFLNQGLYNGQRIINPELLKQMYSEHTISAEWQYNLGITAGLIKERTVLNHNGGGFGFLAAQDIILDGGFGVAALTNSVQHPGKHIQICRNMWDDLFTLQDEGKRDCEPLPESYQPLIGLYEALYNGDSWKVTVIPRNGEIYCNNQKLEHHSDNLFFNEKNDCIEFVENGMIYDNVKMNKKTT